MYCFRCGTKVEETTKFCPHCGANVLEEQQHYNYVQPKKETDHNNTHDEQYKYSHAYSNTEENLMKEYIGMNYEQLKFNRFSFPAFFFGGYYLIYRKMYLYGFLLLVLNFIILCIPALFFVPLLINIILATNFNKLYRNFAAKKIEKIKEKNQTSSSNELIQKCKRKGGTNIAIVIVSFVLLLITAVASIFIYAIVEVYNEEQFKNNITTSSSPTIKDATYQVPKSLKEDNYGTETYKTYRSKNHGCYLSLETSSATTLYPTAEDFLKARVYTNQNDIVSEIQTTPFNNVNWSYISVKNNYKTKHVYTTLYKNTLYKVEIDIYDSNSDETSYQNINTTFMNTVTFR